MNFLKKIQKSFRKVAGWASFVKQVRPSINFEESPIPEAPDYKRLEHWAAHPQKENKTSFTPSGEQYVNNQETAEADVFFIHPTTYFGNTSWNAPINHLKANELVDQLVMPGQASVFNGSCKIYAPRYRQATFYSFIEGKKNARQALEFAYQDVQEAFDFYVKNLNQGRPFFIASHSQGTVHAIRLIEEIVDKHYHQQLVAAYTIGFQFPMDKFERSIKNLKPADSAEDINCIIAWDTFLKTGGPIRKFDFTEHWYPEGWEKRANKQSLCVNPLSWTRSEEVVSADQNEGAIRLILKSGGGFKWNLFLGNDLGIESLHLSEPFPEEVAASCSKKGILYVTKPKHRYFLLAMLPGQNLHNYDYSLFYLNMRKNIAQRLNAFLEKA